MKIYSKYTDFPTAVRWNLTQYGTNSWIVLKNERADL